MPYHYLVLLVAVFTLACGQTSKPAAFGPGKMDPNNGDFGFSLDTLRKHYAAPEKPGESNYFIDLWAEQNLKILAYECKLTNNHALFINSHGGGVAKAHGTRYAFYPHQSLLGPKEKAPYFSAADLGKVLGPATALKIHNIVISGCDTDSSFHAQELRTVFVNATNIIHAPAGMSGYQPMFLQVLTSPSSMIKPIYESCAKSSSGRPKFFMGHTPSQNTTVLSPYVAELFKPGETAPFAVRVAGREMLAPESPSLLQR